MKRILTFTILFFCLNNLFAQTIRDSVFNNVILIKSENISTNGVQFLIDIPIQPQKEPILIFNDNFHIPAKSFFSRNSFLYAQNELLLITTDWVFEKEIRDREKKEGIHIKAHQNKIYHIKRNNSGYEVDSLSIVMHDPKKTVKINFKNPELKKNEIKYFFKECYGSASYPKDSNLALRQERDLIKHNFNEKHNVNVYKNTYKQIIDKEGGHCNYYTLSDLTNKQKIEFLFPQKKYSATDDITKGSSAIISPSIINVENMEYIKQ